jgi:hypothetical protein
LILFLSGNNLDPYFILSINHEQRGTIIVDVSVTLSYFIFKQILVIGIILILSLRDMSIIIDSLILTHKMSDTFEKVNETRLQRHGHHLNRFFQDLSSRVQ